MSKTNLLIYLVCFWTILLILSNIFDVELAKSTTISDDSSTLTNTIKAIPIIGQVYTLFSPLFNIMFFQYPDVPYFISLLLSMVAFFSIYVVYTMIRGY